MSCSELLFVRGVVVNQAATPLYNESSESTLESPRQGESRPGVPTHPNLSVTITRILALLAAIWRRGVRRFEGPLAGNGYTEADWAAEMAALYDAREGPPACPRCRRSGFYGPRRADKERRYRACKFCGLWQDVGKPPHLIIRYECHVADWKEPHEPWNCPTCGRHFGTSQAVGWPADNPEHPWWSVPQGMGHEEACDYFEKRFGLRQPHV
jgi:hypothetical protein